MGRTKDRQGRSRVAVLLLILLALGALWVLVRGSGGQLRSAELARGDFGVFNYDWSAVSLDGETLQADSLGGKTLFVNLWEPWCGPCRAELPAIQRMYEQLAAGVDVEVLLVFRDRPEAARQLIERLGVTASVYHAPNLPVALQPQYVPTTYIVSPKGTIVVKEVGAARWDAPEVVELLRSLD